MFILGYHLHINGKFYLSLEKTDTIGALSLGSVFLLLESGFHIGVAQTTHPLQKEG